MRDKALGLIGLARRAGKLTAGQEACAEAAKEKQACLLLAAADVSERTYRNLARAAQQAEIPVLRLAFGMEEVSRACGRKKTGVLAVTDQGFASALLRELEEKEEQSV